MRQLLRQSNLNLSTTSFKYLWRFFLPLFLLLFSFSLFSSSVKENNATLVEYLAHEKTHLTIAINEIKQKSAPKDEQEYNEKLRQIRTILSMNKAKIESLNSFSENQKKEEVNLNDQLKRLQQMPLANAEVTIQEKVGKIETLLTVNKKTTELIAETLDLAKQYQLLLNDILNELKLWKANFDLKEKLKSIKAIRAKLNKELNILYENAVSSQDQKQQKLTISEQIQYEANLYINNQRIAVIHQKLNVLELQKKVIKTNILLLNNLDTKALQSAIDNYREVINQYSAIESS
ncbi:TPA: mechanosensitive ion channel protein MscS, partial [Legionella pneumophila]|nr:mechanosensitive ion channel protein MscS [Legionella pneumophila]